MLCYRCGTHNPDGSEICIHCGTRFVTRSKAPSPSREIRTKQTIVPVGYVLAERFEIKRFVGDGPVGEVFYAHDKAVNVDLAVKVMAPETFPDDADREKFIWGVRGIKDISHPNLIRLFDAEAGEEGLVFVTMRFVQGVSLKRSIESRTPIGEAFALREIEPLFLQLRDALYELHPSVVHGDLKPSNIIIQPDFLKITDLGLAEFLPSGTFSEAQRGHRDAVYLAPEILSGSAPAPASDIFSIGRLLSMMLIGHAPEDPRNEKFYEGDKQIDDLVRAIYIKATDPDPVKRYRDIPGLFEDLDRVFDRYRELPSAMQTVSKIRKAASLPPEEPLSVDDELIVGPVDEGKEAPAAPAVPSVPPTPAPVPAPARTPLPVVIGLTAVVVAVLIFGGMFLYKKFISVPKPSAPDAAVADAGGPAVAATRDAGVDAAAIPDAAALADTGVLPAAEKDAGEAAGEPTQPEKPEKPPKPEKPEKPDKPEKPGKPEKPEKPDEGEGTAKPDKKKGQPCPKGMALVKAGTVFMGSQPGDKARNPDEQAWTPAKTGSYCVDVFEYPNARGGTPKTSVAYSEAEGICRENGKRLCLEEEWERACKGPHMTRYPYGNDWDPEACVTETGIGEARRVSSAGKFKNCKSGFGVYDMSGNVMEWVTAKSGHVVKGGAANKPDWASRCASRVPTSPGKKNNFTGFRCCVEATVEE